MRLFIFLLTLLSFPVFACNQTTMSGVNVAGSCYTTENPPCAWGSCDINYWLGAGYSACTAEANCPITCWDGSVIRPDWGMTCPPQPDSGSGGSDSGGTSDGGTNTSGGGSSTGGGSTGSICKDASDNVIACGSVSCVSPQVLMQEPIQVVCPAGQTCQDYTKEYCVTPSNDTGSGTSGSGSTGQTCLQTDPTTGVCLAYGTGSGTSNDGTGCSQPLNAAGLCDDGCATGQVRVYDTAGNTVCSGDSGSGSGSGSGSTSSHVDSDAECATAGEGPTWEQGKHTCNHVASINKKMGSVSDNTKAAADASKATTDAVNGLGTKLDSINSALNNTGNVTGTTYSGGTSDSWIDQYWDGISDFGLDKFHSGLLTNNPVTQLVGLSNPTSCTPLLLDSKYFHLRIEPCDKLLTFKHLFGFFLFITTVFAIYRIATARTSTV